jgi:hypothetical protein
MHNNALLCNLNFVVVIVIKQNIDMQKVIVSNVDKIDEALKSNANVFGG